MVRLEWKSIYDSRPGLCEPWIWNNIVLGMIYHLSIPICTCVLRQNNHTNSQFSSNMGTGLLGNGEVGVLVYLWFTSHALWTLYIHQCWLWNDATRVYSNIYTHICVFGRNSRRTTQFSSTMGIGLVENGEVGVEIHLHIIPMSGFMNLNCELVLTLE